MMLVKIISVTSCIVAAVLGDEKRKLKDTNNMLQVVTGLSSLETRAVLERYGCYCYQPRAEDFEDANSLTGPLNGYNGPAVDELDELCRQLYHTKKCVRIDNEQGVFNKPCADGLTERYNTWHDDEKTTINCGIKKIANWGEINDCKNALCTLDVDFVYKVKALLDAGYVRNEAFSADNSNYEDICQNTGTGSTSPVELKCCGTGTSRRSYNSLTSDCCDDGTVKAFGLCLPGN